jgi:hypothetical protein
VGVIGVRSPAVERYPLAIAVAERHSAIGERHSGSRRAIRVARGLPSADARRTLSA